MLTFSVDYFKLNMNCFFYNLLSPEVLWRLSLWLKVLKGTYIHNCIDMNCSIINFVFSFFIVIRLGMQTDGTLAKYMILY